MAKNIYISSKLKSKWPGAALGVLQYEIMVEPSKADLLDAFEETIAGLSLQYSLETIAKNPHIESTRRAYKAFGKSPHEYRNAAEAMLRRIVKGNGLYHINNVVEVNNMISVSSGYSIGSYDLDQLGSNIELRCAEEGSHYDGIGKNSVNIGNLPVLFDETGPFGNPTSDSRRAMIQLGPRKVLSVLYSFDGKEDLSQWMDLFAEKLNQFCGAVNIESWVV